MLKRVDPLIKTKVVSTEDPAIDIEKSPKSEASKLKLKDQDGKPIKPLKYLSTLDLKDLVLVEGENPTYFLITPIKNKRKAEILKDHVYFDMDKRKQVYKDVAGLNVKLFDECVNEVEEDGQITKDINADKYDYSVIQEIGSFVLVQAMVGSRTKKS